MRRPPVQPSLLPPIIQTSGRRLWEVTGLGLRAQGQEFACRSSFHVSHGNRRLASRVFVAEFLLLL